MTYWSRLAALVPLQLCAPALASTWVVDDTSGSGVDFTDIAPALAVAAPGDVIVVRAGSYGPFTVSVGLSILGEPGVVVNGTASVSGVPAGPRAAVKGLQVRSLSISNCAGTVIADEIDAWALSSNAVDVTSCADVRLRRLEALSGPYAGYAVHVQDARVEITDSVLRGRDGLDQIGDCCGGGDGVTGLWLGVSADVHVSRSTIRGGNGGQAETWAHFPGGDGAPAIVVGAASARLLLTGIAADVVQGGAQGLGLACSDDGADGPALLVAAGWARVSGATILGRTSACGAVTSPIVWTGGTLEQPSPADPALSLPAVTPPGAFVTFTLTGPAGAAARLRLGRQATVVDIADVIEDRLTLPLRTYDLGNLPASGTATYAFHLPSALADGFLVVAQGSTVDASGTRLTQSVPIVLH